MSKCTAQHIGARHADPFLRLQRGENEQGSGAHQSKGTFIASTTVQKRALQKKVHQPTWREAGRAAARANLWV